ncbi:XdhC family protein [Nereida sp. MMG025]|uniref:XdhC family protein n=1 Tax=Nereida sp. MMG025 TaxID=2909981 RepID=UPI001F239E96|nr:XdhC family protein [Nereida sp. MMG025]MCF6445355.1 XdhC family protein [Nereida sp. MMG025]
MTQYDDIPAIALAWHRAGTAAAIATVIDTWGSAPRPTGSQLAINVNGEMAGSVSGGCVEGAVVVEAIEAIETGTPKLLEYGVSDDDAFAVGLACGGTIRILVDPVGPVLDPQILEALITARGARQPAALIHDLTSPARHLTTDTTAHDARFRADKSGIDADHFIAIHNPPLRMIITGGVHIAQALIPMARAAGYAPTLIDPREAFASPARFPDTTLVHDWPDAAMTAAAPDARTAVVTLTHDPKLDDAALHIALKSDAFYIGSLGSTRTHAKRVTRLQNEGFTDSQIARIHAPVGLDIGAKSPAEIAVSIMAQITHTLRQ